MLDGLSGPTSRHGKGASIGNLSYTWDANKNKTSESISGVMSGYGFTSAGTTYDHEDRLTGFARASGSFTQSWNLTSVGDWNSVTTNGTAQTRTHGPTHELLTAGGQNVSTDVKGNITYLPLPLGEGQGEGGTGPHPVSLLWDFDNKLKSADVDNNGTADVNFHYDALGRRVARVGSSGSLVYVQLDQQTIADYGYGDNPSSPTYRYVYASYIDEPVVRKGAGTGGTIHYYHRNQQYSINAVTTSTGAVAERYAYTAYGQPTFLDSSGSPLTPQSSTLGNRYTYTGREWDATLGLHHFRARWMSGLTGRFLTRDPIGFESGSMGFYEFLGANPLHRSDPSGYMSYGIWPWTWFFKPGGNQGGNQGGTNGNPAGNPVRGTKKDVCGPYLIVGSCSSKCGDPDVTSVASPGVTLTVGIFSVSYSGGCEITCPGSPGQIGPGVYSAKATARLCHQYKWDYDPVTGSERWIAINFPWVDCGAADSNDTRKCCAKPVNGGTGSGGTGSGGTGSGGTGSGGTDPRIHWPDPYKWKWPPDEMMREPWKRPPLHPPYRIE